MIPITVMAIDASHWASLLEPEEVAGIRKLVPRLDRVSDAVDGSISSFFNG